MTLILVTAGLILFSIGFGLLWRYMFQPDVQACRWCGNPCRPHHTLCDECRKSHDSKPQ